VAGRWTVAVIMSRQFDDFHAAIINPVLTFHPAYDLGVLGTWNYASNFWLGPAFRDSRATPGRDASPDGRRVIQAGEGGNAVVTDPTPSSDNRSADTQGESGADSQISDLTTPHNVASLAS
jgi:hypothetical protein